jgi:hypothetical protein
MAPKWQVAANPFPCAKGKCTLYTAVMAKPTRTMASGQPKKKMLSVSARQEIRTKKSRYAALPH